MVILQRILLKPLSLLALFLIISGAVIYERVPVPIGDDDKSTVEILLDDEEDAYSEILLVDEFDRHSNVLTSWTKVKTILIDW